MLENYFKIAVRNIRRNFVYSFINIFGLAVGLASAIVIGLWVYQEWSYDRHFEHSERIYRVGVGFMNIGDMAPGPEQFSETVIDFPEVELAASLDSRGPIPVEAGEEIFKESYAFFADSNYFRLFSYRFIEGSPEAALRHPNSVVLSEKIARKYFNGRSALGKTIEAGNERTLYTVTGVVKTTEGNSHIPAELWFYLDPEVKDNWLSANYYNYVLLRRGITEEQLRMRLEQLVKNRIYPDLGTNLAYEEWIQTDAAYRFNIFPLSDIYLKSDLRFELAAGGNQNNVYVFGWVAIFIVLIAAVNFVNITTARSAKRAKEVGIRKTLGTVRSSLVTQFMAESVLTSLLALVVALGLAELFLTLFEQYTGVGLVGSFYGGHNKFWVIGAITVGIGLVAGIYPALHLSSYRPVAVLKGHLGDKGDSLFRNGLVVLQFTISVALLASTGVVFSQVKYMQNRDMGLDTENVLIIDNAALLEDQQATFKQALQKRTGVEQVSCNSRIPAGQSIYVNTFRTPEMEEGLPVQTFYGDYDFLSTMAFRLLKGRNFSRDIAADSSAVILNESAVKALELKNPIGSRLNKNELVIGVVSDFNFESLKTNIQPVAIMQRETGQRLAVKVASPAVLNTVQQLWDSYDLKEPMSYYFLDDSYARLMAKEKILARAILLFAVLAFIISCLGLYGLSAYICEQRTKEIGIRKVHGASVTNILLQLNSDFTKPVVVSLLIAIPLSYFLMQSWLNNFAYKTVMNPWIFILACGFALGVAWMTVSWQSIRTSKMNPVNTLRNE